VALGAADAHAWFHGRTATDLVEVATDISVLDNGGWWAVVATFEGSVTLARFASVTEADQPPVTAPWPGVPRAAWVSSTTRADYLRGVDEIRERIRAGTVYQVNLCRRLAAPMPPGTTSLLGLSELLRRWHPAPHAGSVHLPDHHVHVASASPELFLKRDGARVWSSPIKGTAPTADELLPKDTSENVMIVDLVRNDLGRVCETGTVEVDALLSLEPHPGLVHLVSTVSGRLREDVRWADVFAATFPPGSVSGAPKSTALRAISDLEATPRGPYCGAIGWIDADHGRAELAVGIRSFYVDPAPEPTLCFGTGAGITWGSDARREWDETELKAAALLDVAARDGSRS